ncbi:MAG: hypothetical protein NC349_00620 [Paenibacillus sp.]|nr:hypothetical protein [Paenibacillus sp.]
MNDVIDRNNAREPVVPEVRYKSDLRVSRRAFNKFVARINEVYADNIDRARLMVLVLEAYLLGDMVMAMALLDRHGDKNVFMFLKQEVDAAVVRSRRAKALARIRMYSSIPEYVPSREPKVMEIKTGVPKGMEIKTREPKGKKVEAGEPKKLTKEPVVLAGEPKGPHSVEMWRRHLQDTKCAGIRIRREVSAVRSAVGRGYKVKNEGYKVKNEGYKVMRKEDYPCEMNNPPIDKSFINLFYLITS